VKERRRGKVWMKLCPAAATPRGKNKTVLADTVSEA